MTASGSVTGSTRSSSLSYHHPYRLEVRGVTPVSVSLLWSLRPLPLSAIPRNVVRQGKAFGHSPPPSISSPFAASSKTASINSAAAAATASQIRGSPLQRIQAESAGATGAASGASSSIVATRSPNRRVTKVTVRNVSPASRGGRLGKAATTLRRDSGEWPSDDGATAVEEDDMLDGNDDESGDKTNDTNHFGDDDLITPSEASDDVYPSPSTRIGETGVTVSVNGVPWGQVVVGDSGAEEAFVIVYGLHPSREYELLLTVEEKQSAISVATADSEEKSVGLGEMTGTGVAATSTLGEQSSPRGSIAAPPAAVLPSAPTQQPPRIKRTQTPPMQDTDTASADVTIGDTSASLSVPLASGPSGATGACGVTAAALQASVRKARRDASRAESAMRNEIEAIKRGLERMGDVDHRSKQKALALQESIRQATTHAKDIDDEATAVEGEHEAWEKRQREKNDELEAVRTEVEESLRISQGTVKDDNDEVDAAEKELDQIARSVEEKRATKEKLERDKVAEIEQELARIHEEIEATLTQPPNMMLPPSAQYNLPANGPQQQQAAGSYGHGSSPLMPPQVVRGRGGRGGARGAGPVGGGGGGRGGNASVGNATSRRHPHRFRQQGTHQAQYSGGDEHGSNTTHSGSVLNPNNPEFVPSGGPVAAAASAAGQYSMSLHDSPLAPRTNVLPPMDQSPTASNQHSFSAHVGGEMDAPRRASASHLDVNSGSSGFLGGSTWRGGGGSVSPWASQGASPQMPHDIWGLSPAAGSSPLTRHGNLAAPGGLNSSLRNKTSMPFGLETSPLRAGAHSHQDGGDMLRAGYGGEEAGGSSAPVSPTQVRPGMSFPSEG